MRIIKYVVLIMVFAVIIIAQTIDKPQINWVRNVNLGIVDKAYGICQFGNNIAVTGLGIVILLDKNTGDIFKLIDADSDINFINCVSVGDKLYVVGTDTVSFLGVNTVFRGAIAVYDKSLQLSKQIKSPSTAYISIAYKDNYLYIVGAKSKDIDNDNKNEVILLVEKRDTNLNLVNSKEIDDWPLSFATDVEINPATGKIWIVGGRGYSSTIIFVLDDSLNVIKRIIINEGSDGFVGYVNDICFDAGGNAYVAGDRGVAKFDKDGTLITRKAIEINEAVQKVICTENYIFTFSNKEEVGKFLVVRIYDKNLKLINLYNLSNKSTSSQFLLGRAFYDGYNIYVAGFNTVYGLDTQIVIYSIKARDTLIPQTKAVTTSAGASSVPDRGISIDVVLLISILIAVGIIVMALRRRRASLR